MNNIDVNTDVITMYERNDANIIAIFHYFLLQKFLKLSNSKDYYTEFQIKYVFYGSIVPISRSIIY